MIRDAGFKTFNIYVYNGGPGQIDHYVSSNNPGLKTSDFANERFESMLSLRNCANYDAVLFAPNNAFPNIAHISDDDEEETKATKATKVTANTLKKQAGEHRRLALIGEFIVNEICKDFKVV